MLAPGGQLHVATGSYREIDPPRRLVMTKRWESQEGPDTLLTIEIRPIDDGSDLRLLHERFATEGSRNRHNEGWTGCLDRLTELFTH